MGKTEKKLSPAAELVTQVWNQSQQQGKSWIRFNGVMFQAVMLAIESAMVFALEDFSDFYSGMRGGYWFHGDSDAKGESFYTQAVKYDNLSACKSFEKWAGRKPFLLDTGARVAVGHHVDWNGERCTLTSFREDGESIVLCSYRWEKEDARVECPTCHKAEGSNYKLHHRYTVTLKEWTEEMERRKEMRTPPPVGTLVVDPKGKQWVITNSTCRDKGAVSMETVKRAGDSIRRAADTIYSLSYPEFRKQGFKVKAPPVKLRVGMKLKRKGEEWTVTYVSKDGVNVETVARRDENSNWARESHHDVGPGAFLALGFKVVEAPKKKAQRASA